MPHDELHILLEKLYSRGHLLSRPSSELTVPNASLCKDDYLPNEVATILCAQLIKDGNLAKIQPINQPMLPLRGKISTRGGSALKRTDIPDVLEGFVNGCGTDTIFIVQGGNRYIAHCIKARHTVQAHNMKLVCASKATLATILRTILDDGDLMTRLSDDQADRILTLKNTGAVDDVGVQSGATIGHALDKDLLTKSDLFTLLGLYCDYTITTPFAYPTDDSRLRQEFDAMHTMVETNSIEIPNLEIVRILLEATDLRRKLDSNQRIVFIDDLFYRGRTLFTIFCILKSFGIDPRRSHLYTMCADRVSHGLDSEYITVLDPHALYPFENSMRTERGYWQRAHGRFVFADLEDYWQYLAHVVNTSESMRIYEEWQGLLEDLWLRLPPNKLTKKMTYSLIWYLAFHKAHGIPIDLESLIDQRGENIGYCVAYARIIDNFISQEEPVAKRTAFKRDVTQAVNDIWSIDRDETTSFDALVGYYRTNAEAIDYEGLGFMFDVYDYGV